MRVASCLTMCVVLFASSAGGQIALSGAGRQKPKEMPPIPALSHGAAHAPDAPLTLGRARWDKKTVSAVVRGRSTSAPLLHLRGLDGIEKAPGLPDGARRLLEMHVRTLRPGEPDHYMVNVQLAEEWIKAHPVPPDIKPADKGGDDHTGCNVWSTHCAGEVVQHAGGQVSQEWQKLWEQAVADWKHAANELSNDWNMAEGCFADQTLPALNIPVPFKIAPSMALKLETSASKDAAGGTASGTVQGTVGLGFPMESDVQARVELFYIPCLPFVVRPKSLSGAGSLTIGEQLRATVAASGKFDKIFTIPPTGGPQIPIQVIPIIIGDVPIAELDVSAYIEGNVEVGARAKAQASLQIDDPHRATFEFACSGSGCTAQARSIPDPTTATEAAQIQGEVFVKPAIFTALQLDFDVDALSARVGPQPYLRGTADGCAGLTSWQTLGGGAATSESHGLTADLDWGVDLRAEALIARQVIGQPYVHSVTGNKHLWFRDLAGGSTSLVVLSSGPSQATVNKSATYSVRMPSCYPYTESIQYHVTWTGNATPTPTPACHWQSGSGNCSSDPATPLGIGLTWSAPGSYVVTVVAAGDDHHRVFTPAPTPTRIAVTVAAGGGGGSTP